jgi:hypothetical protein
MTGYQGEIAIDPTSGAIAGTAQAFHLLCNTPYLDRGSGTLAGGAPCFVGLEFAVKFGAEH